MSRRGAHDALENFLNSAQILNENDANSTDRLGQVQRFQSQARDVRSQQKVNRSHRSVGFRHVHIIPYHIHYPDRIITGCKSWSVRMKQDEFVLMGHGHLSWIVCLSRDPFHSGSKNCEWRVASGRKNRVICLAGNTPRWLQENFFFQADKISFDLTG